MPTFDYYSRIYQYDTLGRLIAATAGNKFGIEEFSLDSFENRNFAIVDGNRID